MPNSLVRKSRNRTNHSTTNVLILPYLCASCKVSHILREFIIVLLAAAGEGSGVYVVMPMNSVDD